MLGKLLGRVVGEVLALPATIANEAEKAFEEVEKTIDKRYDDFEKEDNKK